MESKLNTEKVISSIQITIEFLSEMVEKFESELTEMKTVFELAKKIEFPIPNEIAEIYEKTKVLHEQTDHLNHMLKGILFAKFNISLFDDELTNHFMDVREIFENAENEEELETKLTELMNKRDNLN